MRHLLATVLLCLVPTLQGCAPVVIAGAAATTASVVHDRRSPGTIVDDQGIELKAMDDFSKDPQLYNEAHIGVTSYNYVVLLTGQAPTEDIRARAEAMARAIHKVRDVHNEVVVAAPNSFLDRSNDGALTAKVKGVLLANSVDPVRVKVVSQTGTVYLMGLVNHEEADHATEVARQTGGVQRVVKLFEYID